MVTLRENLIVLLAALIAFGGSIAAPFQFDDYAIFADPSLTSASGWLEVWSPLNTRPLTYFTFWLNFHFGGRSPWSYHAFNLAIHFACCMLLLDVLSRLLPRRTAFIATLLFAVHPLQSEAVIYIFARSSMLATLFCLVAFRCWLMSERWLAVLWFVPALLAKEECVAFPLFLAMLPAQRLPWKPIAAMCGLSLAAGLRVIAATKAIAGAGSGFGAGISPIDYLAAQGVVILRYLRLFIVPWGFSVDPEIDRSFDWLAWILLLALIAIAWRGRHGAWFLGALVLLAPSSSIFPAADLSADRRMYLPMIALCACAAIMISALCRADSLVRAGPLWRKSWKRIGPAQANEEADGGVGSGPTALSTLAPGGPPYFVVVILAVVSITRVAVWNSEESLWTEALKHAPQTVRPRLMLARAVVPTQAMELLVEAKAIEPENSAVYAEIGRIYLQSGSYVDALAAFGKALALKPGDARSLNNRGVALKAMGQDDSARADFESALIADPCQFDSRINLKRFDSPANCRYSDDQRKAMGR